MERSVYSDHLQISCDSVQRNLIPVETARQILPQVSKALQELRSLFSEKNQWRDAVYSDHLQISRLRTEKIIPVVQANIAPSIQSDSGVYVLVTMTTIH